MGFIHSKQEFLLLDLLISVSVYCAVLHCTVRFQVYWEMRSCSHVLDCSYDEMEACGLQAHIHVHCYEP